MYSNVTQFLNFPSQLVLHIETKLLIVHMLKNQTFGSFKLFIAITYHQMEVGSSSS